MPRRARLDAPGTLHHVIVRGIEKRRIVDDDQDRKMFVDRLGELSQGIQMPVYAWALMTNHGHILLRSGQEGVASFMRKFLTGYAVGYNRRHHRHGHLFQNRYKSIVVEEDTYFKELVRYIHLNPLRARIVESLAELDHYYWSGHSALVGRVEYSWQDTAYVLKLIENYCGGSGISMQTLSGGSRLRHVSRVRRELALRLTEELGLSFAETARHLGVSTSAVAKIMLRRIRYKS
jgi:REP element-mobilizing transposase RayT